MITEAIILAGGLGTRLKSVVADLPKSLAPVAGKPFLAYLLDYAKKEGIGKFIFALGYKTEQVERFVNQYLPEGSYVFSIEEEQLGTGGAIYKACKLVSTADAIVLNADTFFGVSFSELAELHEQRKAACTLALKSMKAFDRYGVVEINEQLVVTGFREKKYHSEGLINGGVYALDVSSFLQKSFPTVFSFEKDYLEKDYSGQQILGLISDAYFIDIGIPDDYRRAQTELIHSMTDDRIVNGHRVQIPFKMPEMFDISHIDKSWTLFLDRDGVINFEIQGTYVRNWKEFIFYPRAPENIAYFNTRFQRLVLATNQRGITKAIMTLEDLEEIHVNMIKGIEAKGGKIDRIYFCVDAEASSSCRKPNPGMAFQAARDFPEINLKKSLMVGNNLSDMLFGKNAGMKTVFLKTTDPERKLPHEAIDLHFNNLDEFAEAMRKS